MSITLRAYPMAFLLSPDAVNEQLNVSQQKNTIQNATNYAVNDLKFIKVLTNIKESELDKFFQIAGCTKFNSYYKTPNNIRVDITRRRNYIITELSGGLNGEYLQHFGEDLFIGLDFAAKRNVRLLESCEYFYYNYATKYTDIKEIYTVLKEQGATGIFSTSDNEIVANINDQSVKYYKSEGELNYTLEVEQKFEIVNIGPNGQKQSQGNRATYGLTDLKIQTNIKPDELKKILHSANYEYYEADHSTPLKNITLNWTVKNGVCVAEFTGSSTTAISKEAENIFKKMNIAAGRDLRLINDTFSTVYTYNTNYTDKGMLINTLTEHGAQALTENGDEIRCKLFDMEMVYYRKDESCAYILDITRVTDKNECECVINDLNDEYGLNIQEMTYNKIKERLEKESMRLESESVMEDNSIVLTIEV